MSVNNGVAIYLSAYYFKSDSPRVVEYVVLLIMATPDPARFPLES